MENNSKNFIGYTWSLDSNEEWHNAVYDTIKECIEDAKKCEVKSGETIYIGRCTEYIPKVNIDKILEDLEQDAYEIVGDAMTGWLEHNNRYLGTEPLQNKFDTILMEWLKETNQLPHFYLCVPYSKIIAK